jgi:hypothetical protein
MIRKVKRIEITKCWDCPFANKKSCTANCEIILKNKETMHEDCPLKRMSFIIQEKENKKEKKNENR